MRNGCDDIIYIWPKLLITNQVVTYLESNNLLTRDKSAYCAQHNTQTTLHKVVDDWLYNITDGLHTTVFSFGIRKCFDMINI